MVAAIVSVYRIVPGGGDAFRLLAGQAKAYVTGFGGDPHFRTNLFAGESTG